MESLAVLRQAHDAGLKVWVDGDDLQVEGRPTPEALAALDCLREHKAEILAALRRQRHGDGEAPPLDRPPETEQGLRRLIDYLSDPESFDRWLEWAMNYFDPAEGPQGCS